VCLQSAILEIDEQCGDGFDFDSATLDSHEPGGYIATPNHAFQFAEAGEADMTPMEVRR
jgi:hypothetical protein